MAATAVSSINPTTRLDNPVELVTPSKGRTFQVFDSANYIANSESYHGRLQALVHAILVQLNSMQAEKDKSIEDLKKSFRSSTHQVADLTKSGGNTELGFAVFSVVATFVSALLHPAVQKIVEQGVKGVDGFVRARNQADITRANGAGQLANTELGAKLQQKTSDAQIGQDYKNALSSAEENRKRIAQGG